MISVKGAPDVMLEHCTHYQRINDDGGAADRRLALAHPGRQRGHGARGPARAGRGLPRDRRPAREATAEAVEHDLVFLGLFGMIDPPGPRCRRPLPRRAGPASAPS